MMCLPLAVTPVGWLVFGLGGYALYRFGKKKGEKEAAASGLNEAIKEIPEKTTITKGA